MSQFENIVAFEAALKESKELQEKFEAAKKRIVENKEAANDVEMVVKAAAEVGFTLTVAETERSIVAAQEINDEELANVSGGSDYGSENGGCVFNHSCLFFFCSKDSVKSENVEKKNYVTPGAAGGL